MTCSSQKTHLSAPIAIEKTPRVVPEEDDVSSDEEDKVQAKKMKEEQEVSRIGNPGKPETNEDSSILKRNVPGKRPKRWPGRKTLVVFWVSEKSRTDAFYRLKKTALS